MDMARGSAPVFQIDDKGRDVRRGDAGDPAGLAQVFRADGAELFPRFQPQARGTDGDRVSPRCQPRLDPCRLMPPL